MTNTIHTFVVLAYKESPYLEDCIKSVLHQKYKSNVLITTSTPNDYITNIAKKYNLDVLVNPNPGQGIGNDFDYAVQVANTPLTTNAHQDDIYDYEYASTIVDLYTKNPNALILFSDYYEIRNNQKVLTNTNLKIKRILLFPGKLNHALKGRFSKRWVLRFGNAICCPAVTFVKPNIQSDTIFQCDMKSNIDWFAWERLSNMNGSFVYASQKLMGHRVHEQSTTTEIIHEGVRTKEDYVILTKFWPLWLARFINSFYKNSENSNS